MKYCFIFDLDGLLVDTQLPFHAKAESMIFAQHGLVFKPSEISQRYAGISTRKIFEELLPQQDSKLLVQQKWEIMRELTETVPLIIFPGMLEVCGLLKARGVPIIIASASPKSWIQTCLGQAMPTELKINSDYPVANFLSIFGDNFVSAEDCQNGKPAPDVFLLAKSKLLAFDHDLDKSKWIVVGDGESDVLGGLAANMEVLFLSENNTSHDSNLKVKRFSNSVKLAKYIEKLASND